MLDVKIVNQFRKVLSELADEGRLELARQGHKATGRGIQSIEAIVTTEGVNSLIGRIVANDYLIPVDTGVKASRVPYGGQRGRARVSQYIQGLLNWIAVIKPGLADKERRSFAFAIANTHKREGIPSRGSYSFSQNGRRKDWIKNGLEEPARTLEDDLRLFALLSQSFEQAIAAAAA